jgi:hypothetical protein
LALLNLIDDEKETGSIVAEDVEELIKSLKSSYDELNENAQSNKQVIVNPFFIHDSGAFAPLLFHTKSANRYFKVCVPF